MHNDFVFIFRKNDFLINIDGHSSSHCWHQQQATLSSNQGAVEHFVVTLGNAWQHWGQLHSLNCGPGQMCVFAYTPLSLFPTFLHCVFFRLISLHTFIVSHMLGHIILFGKRDRATINANLCVLNSYPEGFVQLCPNSKYFKHTQFHQVVHASENFPGFS